MKDKITPVYTREEVDKRNFTLSTVNGTLFRAGFEYINAFTVLSVFIHTLTGSVALAGLSQFFQSFFSQLGRVINAPRIHTIKKQPIFMGNLNLIARLGWFFLALMMFLDVGKNVLIPTMFIIIAVSWFCGGMMWPVFEDHFARTILPRRRSELLGAREFWGGVAAFIGSFVVKQVLGSHMQFNNKYGLLFLLGFVFLISSGFTFYSMRDINHSVDSNPMPLSAIFKNIRSILSEDKNYRWYLLMRTIWIVTDSALLLSLIAVKEVGNLDDMVVSYLLIAQIIGRIGGGVLWGKVAKISGSRNAIITVQILNIIAAAAMIAVVGSSNVSTLVYIIVSFAVGVITPGVMLNFVYFSETTHMKKRPVFMTVEGIISMPLAFVSYLFGKLSESVGFVPIYSILIAGACMIFAIAFFKLLKRHEINPDN